MARPGVDQNIRVKDPAPSTAMKTASRQSDKLDDQRIAWRALTPVFGEMKPLNVRVTALHSQRHDGTTYCIADQKKNWVQLAFDANARVRIPAAKVIRVS